MGLCGASHDLRYGKALSMVPAHSEYSGGPETQPPRRALWHLRHLPPGELSGGRKQEGSGPGGPAAPDLGILRLFLNLSSAV